MDYYMDELLVAMEEVYRQTYSCLALQATAYVACGDHKVAVVVTHSSQLVVDRSLSLAFAD